MADHTLDTRPKEANIAHYGGDTLTIKVTAPAGLTDGREWHAQVRANRNPSTPIDATFTIIPPSTSGGPAFLVLPSDETARLALEGTPSTRSGSDCRRSIVTYRGVWDVQISDPVEGDPVTTLAQGTLSIELDVTRVA